MEAEEFLKHYGYNENYPISKTNVIRLMTAFKRQKDEKLINLIEGELSVLADRLPGQRIKRNVYERIINIIKGK